MASLVPSLNSSLGRMTSGEKRFARRLESHLEDDYLVWFDVPVGKGRAHPDFVVLHPSRGILILEVKDWRLDKIQKMTRTDATILTGQGAVTKPNPLEQARAYAHLVADTLKRDAALRHPEQERYAGGLVMPWGYGVVLAGMTRKQFESTDLNEVLPANRVICGCEMTESADPEAFQEKLWNMFTVSFPCRLTLPQVDRIRYHLFPEIRINPTEIQGDLLDGAEPESAEPVIPDLIRVMDMQQELLARSMGEGHRVIHGVAGSGKTMILGYRAQHLSKLTMKPILVLCFNVALSAKLAHFMAAHGLEDKVHVRHFHGWCNEQLTLYHVKKPPTGKDYFERLPAAVIDAVETGAIPRAQYGAILIDEGHDFQQEWLQLVTQMLDPTTNALLLLYDDAQDIYKSGTKRKFSLKSVGIQAQGRTTILKLNYRNTEEVLGLAYEFAKDIITPEDADEDGIPLVMPESAGRKGARPALVRLKSLAAEAEFIVQTLKKRHAAGTAWGDMAVIYRSKKIGMAVMEALEAGGVPSHWLNRDSASRHFNPDQDSVKVMTFHASKGLEFDTAIVPGIGYLPFDDDSAAEARLLYVAMTRAMNHLLLTASHDSEFFHRLKGILGVHEAGAGEMV